MVKGHEPPWDVTSDPRQSGLQTGEPTFNLEMFSSFYQGHLQERLGVGSVAGQCRKLLRETKAIPTGQRSQAGPERSWQLLLSLSSSQEEAQNFSDLLKVACPGKGAPDPEAGPWVWGLPGPPWGGALGLWTGPVPLGLCFSSSEGVLCSPGAGRRKGVCCHFPCLPPAVLQTLWLLCEVPSQMLMGAGKEGGFSSQAAHLLLAVSFTTPEGESRASGKGPW